MRKNKKNAPQTQQEQNISDSKGQVVQVASAFSGPLPPPNILAQYNKVIPNAAERILQMAEKEGEHRRRMEEKLISSETSQIKIGSIFAFFLGMTALIGGFILAYFDKNIVGIGAIIAGLGTIITAFIAGSKKDKNK